jgi:CheY-like chemotaxis protein/two-component sensor histidine kinase
MDELNELKGQFLASLNHEIRTPLSGILGMTDLLLETPLTDDQREYVGATRSCAQSLLEIFNATLEFSALSANNIRLEESEFSLRETLQGLIAEFSSKAQAKGLRLINTLDHSLPATVSGDAVRVRQLLSNLVSNAVKFTTQGEIEIRASAGAADKSVIPISIAVRDTGIGISPDQLNFVFECFQQLETGLARNYHGLGLGLAVAQKLAILLKATISIESEPGHGSTFSVSLPLRLPSEAAALRSEVQQLRGDILVVDDNLVAQTIASHVLRRHSFDVQCAGDGKAAFQAASRHQFNLILMDLQMPGWDGFETTEQIRTLPGYSDIPIIALTANSSSDFEVRCLDSGMQGFLAKPVRTKDLVAAVEQYLEKSSAH